MTHEHENSQQNQQPEHILQHDGDALRRRISALELQVSEQQQTIAMLISQNSLLEQKAETHPVTGLPGRRALLREIERDIRELQRLRYQSNKELVEADAQTRIMFIDLDHFKQVNDEMGYDTGNLLLTEVGLRLYESTRPEDFVAQLGGDEYVVLLRHLASNDMPNVLARLQQAITLEDYGVTGTFGIHTIPVGYTNPEDVLKGPEEEMKRRKAGKQSR